MAGRSPTTTRRTTSGPTRPCDIEKYTNGEDADTPTGPLITVGDPVAWTYVVTNTGNVAARERDCHRRPGR